MGRRFQQHVVDAAGAAKHLGISTDVLYKHARNGRLRGIVDTPGKPQLGFDLRTLAILSEREAGRPRMHSPESGRQQVVYEPHELKAWLREAASAGLSLAAWLRATANKAAKVRE
jgi:hypothetical protein